MTPSTRRLALPSVAVIVLLALPVLLGFVGLDSWTFNFAFAVLYAIAIMGLNILTGYSGQISLGHGAFLALGAYTSAILQQRYAIPYLLTIPAAGVLCGVLGFLFGFPALRLTSLYLALATFALAVATPSVLKKFSGLTGGVKGIILDPVQPPFGLSMTPEQWEYYLSLVIALLLFLFAWNLLRGRTGRAFRALRDSELAAASYGVDLRSYKTLAFGLSAGYAGVAGALFAIDTAFVSPDSFDFPLSLALLAGAVVGGLALIDGAVWGALFVEFLPIVAQRGLEPVSKQIANAAPAVTYGVLLILIMFLARDGIAGAGRRGYISLRQMAGVGARARGPGAHSRDSRDSREDEEARG